MKSLRIKLFDNYIVVAFYLFLAFGYALTFRIGFPLKISELALGAILILLLVKARFSIVSLNSSLNKLLLAFTILVAISTFVNLLWHYPYPYKVFTSRFGYRIDSILKLIYILLALFAYILTINSLSINKEKYLKVFLTGAIVAALYGWYLFISSFIGIDYIILPGMSPPLQKFALLGRSVVRNGTFLEGNYMGLFLLIACIVSFYMKRLKTAIFLMVSIISTVSTMAISCLIIFLGLHFFKKYFTKKHLPKLFAISILGLIIISLLSATPAFRAIVIDKVLSSTDKITQASYSKAERLTMANTAISMGTDNPILGVGIANYSLHYDQYNFDERFRHYGARLIPNNVYAEIFAETGVIGLVLFLLFYLNLLKISLRDQSGVLRNGLFVLAIYFLTFPTFTILYIWFFFGLVASTEIEYESL